MKHIELIWDVERPEALNGLEALLDDVAGACLAVEGIDGAGFGIRIVDGATIRTLNREMRNIDRETDVLSFPTVQFPKGKTARDCPRRLQREYDPCLDSINLGDCAIDLERARAQAAEYGHSLKRELCYLTAHSAFHLMGYDHMEESEKRQMREMEERALSMLGITRENDIDADALFNEAVEAMKQAYCPYSKFQVGACILTDDGRTFRGCNFENASYGASICAERCAAGNAVVNGARKFKAIAVVGSAGMAWPCGICRQVLREFSDLSMPVIVGQYEKGYTIRTLGELLPEGFSPQDLGVDPDDRSGIR